MTKQEIADNIVLIVKDLNVFVRAANRLNLLVDSNLGQLIGSLQVAVIEFTPALATSASDENQQDDIEKRAEHLVNDGFKEIDHSNLGIIDDTTKFQTIEEIGEVGKLDATVN